MKRADEAGRRRTRGAAQILEAHDLTGSLGGAGALAWCEGSLSVHASGVKWNSGLDG